MAVVGLDSICELLVSLHAVLSSTSPPPTRAGGDSGDSGDSGDGDSDGGGRDEQPDVELPEGWLALTAPDGKMLYLDIHSKQTFEEPPHRGNTTRQQEPPMPPPTPPPPPPPPLRLFYSQLASRFVWLLILPVSLCP